VIEFSQSVGTRKERLRPRIYWIGAAMFVALLVNGMLQMWFSYQEHRAALTGTLGETAAAAAKEIDRFIEAVVSQVGRTTQLPWSPDAIEQRRLDARRLLRQVPAVTRLAELDPSGKEQVRVSQNPVVTEPDYDYGPNFAETVAGKTYYSPANVRHMTITVGGTQPAAGVSVAEVDLKFIWDVVNSIKVGEHGQAYVVDAQGRLIAHSDISLALLDTDVTRLDQVKAALAAGAGAGAEPVREARDINGRKVLTAYAVAAPSLGWRVFVEVPSAEAYAPLYSLFWRSLGLPLIGLTFALFGIAWLSWRPNAQLGAQRGT
jgi:Cache domain